MPPGVDVPEQLGRYEIVQRLSAGGMGEVFVARFAGPGGFLKPVALKRIHPHLASDEAFIHMLHDEANVTAAIKHPNVVQIIEVGFDNDSHFVVLDYVSGETLSKVRRELHRRHEQMPLWLVAWVGAEVAAALHAAHEARSLEGEQLEIIHRDVSLANVMLSDDGRPMLFDFGVAKAKQRLTHTTAGELKGKVAYMAPEIFHGASVNRTVDIYALGVVLYELATGKSPFQRDSDLETIAAIQNGEPDPITEKRPEVDWLLDAIVMRTMARERDERYQTGAQLEQALREWARKNQQPHDMASASQWLASAFPDKLQERRALLSRVASRQRLVTSLTGPLSTSGTNPTFGRSGGREDPQSGSLGARTPPPVAPSVSPPAEGSSSSLPQLSTDNPFASPPSSKKWLGIAGAVGACALGVAVTLAATSRPSAAPAAQPVAPPSASVAPALATSSAAPPPVASSAPPAATQAPVSTKSQPVAGKTGGKTKDPSGSTGAPVTAPPPVKTSKGLSTDYP